MVTILESVNFGPQCSKISVAELTEIGSRTFPILLTKLKFANFSEPLLEAGYLEIDSQFSHRSLNWSTKWDSKDAIELTFEWWKKFLAQKFDPAALCGNEVYQYLSKPNSRY